MLNTRTLGVLLALGVLAIGAAAKYSHSRAKVRCGLPARDYRVAKYSQTMRALSSVAVPIPAPAPTIANAAAADPSLLGSPADLVGGLPLSGSPTSLAVPQSATDAVANLSPQRIVGSADSALPTGGSLLPLLVARAQTERAAAASGLNAAGLTGRLKTFQFVDTPVLQIDHCSISDLSVQIQDTGHWVVSLRADQNPAANEPDNGTRKVTTAEPSRKFSEHLQGNQFHVRVHCFANHGPVNRRSVLGKSKVISLNLDPFWVQKGVSLPHVVPGHSREVQAFFQQIDRVEIEFYYRIE